MRTALETYRGFIDALNTYDLERAADFVDAERYRETCIGYIRGMVDWDQARESMRKVWQGLPDLRVDLVHIASSGDYVVAHGSAHGSATGRLFGAPATGRRSKANFFDYARVADGLIVERIQQSDIFTQMRQMYGKPLGLVGLGAMFLRNQPNR